MARRTEYHALAAARCLVLGNGYGSLPVRAPQLLRLAWGLTKSMQLEIDGTKGKETLRSRWSGGAQNSRQALPEPYVKESVSSAVKKGQCWYQRCYYCTHFRREFEEQMVEASGGHTQQTGPQGGGCSQHRIVNSNSTKYVSGEEMRR